MSIVSINKMIPITLRQVSDLIPGPPCSPSLPFYSNGSNTGCIQSNGSIPVTIPTVGWVAAPSSRSTFGIVWSCLFTLFTCTWTALHLNIPRKGEGFWSKFLRKMKWMTLTMVAPEYTFWVASGQRSVAIKSQAQLRKYGSWDWTTTHAFYAAMGGFVLVDKEDPDARFPISIEEIIKLLDEKQIPPESVEVLQHLRMEDIEDRSKANSFAKGLACIQFVWLGMQCSARAAQHLPFTLLELVTVAEAIITIGTYIMWWNKPLDVVSTIEVPISRTSDLTNSICNPANFRYNHYELWGPIVQFVPAGASVYRIRNGFRIANDTEESLQIEQNIERHLSNFESSGLYAVSSDSRLSQARVSASPDMLQDRRAMMTPANRPNEPQRTEEHDIDSSSVPLQRFSMSTRSNAINDSIPAPIGHEHNDEEFPAPTPPESIPNLSRESSTIPGNPNRDQYIRRFPRTDTQSNRPATASETISFRHGLLEDWKGTFKVTAPFFEASFLAVGFGALHTAAWDFHFPTLIERNLWRISSLILATSLPGYFLCWIFIRAHRAEGSPQHPAVLRCIVILIGGVYVLARLYTLAECLASLRKQPIGVYETTQWTFYLPHF